VSTAPCLACHGPADEAPRSMIVTYGTQSGYGWKLNEIVGAQIVSVPMAVALEQATRILNLFIAVLAGVFPPLIWPRKALPFLMATLRADARAEEMMVRPLPVLQSVKAFGYGLLAAGAVVVIVVYVVIYARRGVAGLQMALDPFAPISYVSIAAILPGML